MIKATAIAVLLMVASSTAAFTPKIAPQEVYDAMVQWKDSLNSTSSTKKLRDNTSASCCPISGLGEVTGILTDDAESLATDLSYYGEVVLSAESCTLVDCSDSGGGIMACNFNSYAIEVPGATLGDFTDLLAYACSSDGYTCGLGLDSTVQYNVWTENGACSI